MVEMGEILEWYQTANRDRIKKQKKKFLEPR